MAPSLQIQEQDLQKVVVLRLAGNLNVDESRQLQDRLMELMDAGRKRIVIGLENVKFIDSSGIGRLVGAHLRAEREGGKIMFAGPSAHVMELLRVTRLAERLHVRERTEVAVDEMLAEEESGKAPT